MIPELTQRVAREAQGLALEVVGYPTPPADIGEAGNELWATFSIVLKWRNLWDSRTEAGLHFLTKAADLLEEKGEYIDHHPPEMEWLYYVLAKEIFRPDVKKALKF